MSLALVIGLPRIRSCSGHIAAAPASIAPDMLSERSPWLLQLNAGSGGMVWRV